jgi:hypothetical protein
VRYQARVYGYAYLLLTPAYPGGLYGDRQATASWADVPDGQDVPPAAPGYETPGPGYGTPGQGYGTQGPGYGSRESVYGLPGSPYGTPGPVFDTPAGGAPGGYGGPGYGGPGYGTPGYGAPGGYGYAAGYGRPVFQPATWLLRLTAGARRWVTAFIVIGALVMAGQATLNVLGFANGFHGFSGFGINSVRASIDRSQLSTSYSALNRTMTAWQSATAACDHKLTCVTKQDAKASRGFNTFADQMYDPLVPSGAAADQNRLIADARTLSHDFSRLSKSATVAGYQATFTSTPLQLNLDTFDKDYKALVDNLRSS